MVVVPPPPVNNPAKKKVQDMYRMCQNALVPLMPFSLSKKLPADVAACNGAHAFSANIYGRRMLDHPS